MSVAKEALDRNEKLETTRPVTGLRPERGYSVTKYDGSASETRKTVRRHFGRFYDAKKVRNTYDQSVQFGLEIRWQRRRNPNTVRRQFGGSFYQNKVTTNRHSQPTLCDTFSKARRAETMNAETQGPGEE